MFAPKLPPQVVFPHYLLSFCCPRRSTYKSQLRRQHRRKRFQYSAPGRFLCQRSVPIFSQRVHHRSKVQKQQATMIIIGSNPSLRKTRPKCIADGYFLVVFRATCFYGPYSVAFYTSAFGTSALIVCEARYDRLQGLGIM